MSTIRTTITVVVETYSEASDADHHPQHEELVQAVVKAAEDIKYSHTWLKDIYTDWEQSTPMEIRIDATSKKGNT